MRRYWLDVYFNDNFLYRQWFENEYDRQRAKEAHIAYQPSDLLTFDEGYEDDEE